MHVAALQWKVAWLDREANYARVRALVTDAGVPAGSLIVLPEMFATGFSGDPEAVEPEPGPTLAFLQDLARATGCAVVGGRAVRRHRGRPENRATAVSASGQVRADYAKVHAFLGWEQAAFGEGRRVVTFREAGAEVAPFVCYDLRFPELFRQAVRREAEVLVVVANWPAARAAHWDALLRARAIENQAFVVGVNRTGADPNLAYPGRTQVLDPQGRILAEAGAEETVVRADLDLASLRAWRQAFPAIRDIKGWLVPSVEDGS